MRKSKYTDEQVAMAIRQAEAGTPVAEICRKLGITETTFRCRDPRSKESASTTMGAPGSG